MVAGAAELPKHSWSLRSWAASEQPPMVHTDGQPQAASAGLMLLTL